MAPHALLARQDAASSTDSASTSSSTDPTSSDSSNDSGGSFMDQHGKQIYIALAVVGLVLLLVLIWGYAKSRLSFWPFNQKRCSGPTSCGSGIPKAAKLDDDYFKNDSGGWRCRKCQEKKEDQDLEDELEADMGEKKKGGGGRGKRDNEKGDDGRKDRGDRGDSSPKRKPQNRSAGKTDSGLKDRVPPRKKEEERATDRKPTKRREEDYSSYEYDEPEPRNPRKSTKSKKKVESDDGYSD